MVVPKKANPEEVGSLRMTLAVFMSMLVVIVIVVVYFSQALRNQEEIYTRAQHTAEEAAAYRFATQRDKARKAVTACEAEVSKHQATKIWIEQNTNKKLPPELSTDVSCVVEEKE